MGAQDEAIAQLKQALEDWDFTPAFPSGYPSTAGVIVETANPWQILPQIQVNPSTGQSEITSVGQMAEYMISLQDMTGSEVAIRLGDVYGQGSQSGTVRYGKRMVMPILVGCWADQRLGGMDAARAIGSQVMGCTLYNKNRLTSFTHLRVRNWTAKEWEGAQLYSYNVVVEGEAIVSVDY